MLRKEEEECRFISEEQEEEVPYLDQDYGIPSTQHTYPGPEVRSRNTSPSVFGDHNNSNSGNRSQGSYASRTFNSAIPRVNRMVVNDINLPIFNGNGLEDP